MERTTRKSLRLVNAGFLANMQVGQTMRWAATNNVSIKRTSFAFFECRWNGQVKLMEGCEAYKWLTTGVCLL